MHDVFLENRRGAFGYVLTFAMATFIEKLVMFNEVAGLHAWFGIQALELRSLRLVL